MLTGSGADAETTGYWNDTSHLVNVVVTFRRRLDSAATVGVAVNKRLQLGGVHHALGITVSLIADDDMRYIRSPRPSSGSRLASFRQEHLVLQTVSLVETFAAVDAINNDEQVACNSQPDNIDILS